MLQNLKSFGLALAKLSADDRTLILHDGALKPTTVVKNLGVYVNQQMTMDSNARQYVKTSFCHMRRIRQTSVCQCGYISHASSCTDIVTLRLLQQPVSRMHSVNITSSTACPGLCGQTTVMQVHVLMQAHCVSNYTGCQCPAVSNTGYVC